MRARPAGWTDRSYVFLRDGTWDGQEVVSPDWVRASVAPAIAVDGPWVLLPEAIALRIVPGTRQ